jgi:phenylacetic acid degradation operon negative regulatory protein
LLAPLGINERLARTSVYRLAREGWLESRQTGRRSRYRLTRQGLRRFEGAYRRIYATPLGAWDGTWQLVVAPPAAIEEDKRRELRKELWWEGFGTVTPGLFIRPTRAGTDAALAATARALGVQRSVVLLTARDLPTGGGKRLKTAAGEWWNLRILAAEYRSFLRRFSRVIGAFDERAEHDPQQCFVVRTLLIHAFRRAMLHDPQLPAELLPRNWPGPAASALCRDFYRLTHRQAERHLASTLATELGELPAAAAYFYRRFGGLERCKLK